MKKLKFKYCTVELGDHDIHLRTLKNNQQFLQDDGECESLGISSALWPIFGVLWPSGYVLAHKMLNHEIQDKRILEIGCGIALSSHLLNSRDADITATDYHPSVEEYLNINSNLNLKKPIPFERIDWNDQGDALGKFDLIIGSDILYQTDHADPLAEFVIRHSNTNCEVIIVDPGRRKHSKFTKLMQEAGFNYKIENKMDTSYLPKEFKGSIYLYRR